MELKIYLKILLRKWWIVLSAFLITFTATTVFVFTRPRIYEAVVTFVVVPDRSLAGGMVYGLDTVSRQPEICSTYAEVAVSRLVRQRAADKLGLSSGQMADISIDAKPLAGTNLLRITVRGGDPVPIRDVANMVGDETVAYVQELYEIYDLKLLDGATIPTSPVEHNRVLYLALGAVLGCALGGGLAFLSEYLQTPLETAAQFDISDNEGGLRRRLREEMSWKVDPLSESGGR